MRRDRLGARTVSISVMYSDGIKEGAVERGKHLFVLDSEILAVAERLYKKAVTRRIRIRSIRLSLEDLRPLAHEPDLFEPEILAGTVGGAACSAGGVSKQRRLQEAVDLLQARYGAGKICRAIVLAASVNN